MARVGDNRPDPTPPRANMPIKVTCSKCQGVLHAPDDAGGKRGKCPTCGNVLSIPGGSGGSMIPPEPEPSAAGPSGSSLQTRLPSAVFGSPAEDSRKASFAPGLTGQGGTTTAPLSGGFDARNAPVSRPSPAPSEARKSGDPFSKAGPRAPAPGADAEWGSQAWRRTRRGLWFVQAGYFFALVAVALPAGLAIAVKAGVKLPAKPGLLKLADATLADEIRAAAFLIPAALAFAFVALGRLGATNAPRTSYARGLLRVSALATLMSLIGATAVAVIVGLQVAGGDPPSLLPPEESRGVAQRVGIAVAAVLAPVAELWFVIALGRMGAGLRDDRLAGRGTRALVYAGLLFTIAGLATYAVSYYHAEIDRLVADQFQPKLNSLGDKQGFVWPGVAVVAGLSVWLVYVRLVGAARGAIHNWLDVNRG